MAAIIERVVPTPLAPSSPRVRVEPLPGPDVRPAPRRRLFAPAVANERMKDRFNSVLFGSVALAALLHFLVLAFFPHISTQDFGIYSREMLAIEVPPQVEIPPPPGAIARPQVPILSTRLDISQDITIQEVTFSSNPVENLPPPSTETKVDLSEQPAFTPRTVEPVFSTDSRLAVQRFLEKNYPTAMRDAGIGARAVLWVFIETTGEVRNTRIVESSGYPAFDDLAREAMQLARFTPAYNRDVRVPVWVQIPISWQVLR